MAQNCPVIELLITFKYGLPVYSWVNTGSSENSTNISRSEESQSLIAGLLAAILSFSESLSDDTGQVQQVKMARTTYQYSIQNHLIFFLGYDNSTSEAYEPIIDDFLSEAVSKFNKMFNKALADDNLLLSQDFGEFEKYISESSLSERWKLERTQDEILKDIQELLLDILGPISAQILDNNIKALRSVRRSQDQDTYLTNLAENLVYEISLLMDPSQAKQIGDEITTIIYA